MMNLLKAEARSTGAWWEIRLLELDIVADGSTEAEMLDNLRHSLIAQYHLDIKMNKTPFVGLIRAKPLALSDAANSGSATRLRDLGLPDVVTQALALVLHKPTMGRFQVDISRNAA